MLFEPKDWIQVEVTSRCNAACFYCPRTCYRQQWHNRSMSMDTFRRLVPALSKTTLAYLQGWGEPLLHPDLANMVRLAKQAGCMVGTTTNGMLLDESSCHRLMDAGLDILAFSLAGTTSAGNDSARAGTRFDVVLEKMEMVRRIKGERQASLPAVHIAYMLLGSGLGDLQGLPRLMADHGVEQAVVSVLDFEAGIALSREVLAAETLEKRSDLQVRFDRLKRSAADLGLTIHTPDFASMGCRDRPCSENIAQALCIGADGSVAPCVYLNLPVEQGVCLRQAQQVPYRRLTFGNVNELMLPEVWRGETYTRFRDDLGAGRMSTFCRHCPKRGR
ncbi:radical SAM protein [Desulfobulbus alkaliphilus]|uniref:radical SAM protein n=1 Tax=Desulfobulbus alkaliphilus TaxID=869814 RepID=UPI001964A82F|nr:radical SAM protein [Desulfobulbus alkaliphilus]